MNNNGSKNQCLTIKKNTNLIEEKGFKFNTKLPILKQMQMFICVIKVLIDYHNWQTKIGEPFLASTFLSQTHTN